MRQKEHHYLYQVDKHRAYAQLVMSLLPLFSILLIIYIEIKRGEQMTVTTTFTIVSIIASTTKTLKSFVDVLDKYYMFIESKKAVNRLLFSIPDKPGFDITQNGDVKTGEIILEGSYILSEDQQAMNLALSKIFGDQFDHEEEMGFATYQIRQDKMKEYSKQQEQMGLQGGDRILGRAKNGDFIMGDSKSRKNKNQKLSNVRKKLALAMKLKKKSLKKIQVEKAYNEAIEA